MINDTNLRRTGVLTFLLGAGICIAIGSAGAAWADSDAVVPQTHSSARAVAHRPAPARAETAPRRTTPSGPTAARRSTDPGRPVVPTPAAAAAASKAQPTAKQLSGPLARHQMTVTILPKIPLGLPATTIPFVKKVNGFATFTPKSVYDLHNVDQFDWNKLSGISFSIPGDLNSTMVAWRYNVESGNFEVAPFFNVDKARILPTPSEIITIPIGETFDFTVDYNGITIANGDKTVYKPTPEGLKPNVWTSYRTSVWFGGTSLPPNLIKLKLGFTR